MKKETTDKKMSTGMLRQDSAPHKNNERSCREDNGVTSRNAAPERTLNVREEASTGMLRQDSATAPFNFGIYIHWPFCLSKCPYCDFYSRVAKNHNQDDLINEYLDDLNYYYEITQERTVTSIFFGGGTPSLISAANIERIIDFIDKHWKLSSQAEISLEANPNTQTPTLFSDLRQVGINRLSLGVQALNDADLKFLGRTHSVNDALKAIDDVTKYFNNHSMDLIYARPQQTLSQWQTELQQAVGFGFKHLSLYQLTIEEGTVFAKKGICAMNDETAAELYAFTNQFLSRNGYPRYEVSNYAQPDFQCRHNLLYWQGDEYLGIGRGAHGRLKKDGRFYALTYKRLADELSAAERAEELIIMGLRLSQGIDKCRFKDICGIDFDNFINQNKMNLLQQSGLIENTKQNLHATEKGFLLLNHLIEELCC